MMYNMDIFYMKGVFSLENTISIIKKDISAISEIKDLWTELNKLHIEKSVNFKSKYDSFKFEERFDPLLHDNSHSKFNFDVLFDNKEMKNIGYCLSSITEDSGEVQSLFVLNEYRRMGLGDKLFNSAMDFFEDNNIEKIFIKVVYNNEKALGFYKKHGFLVSAYTLTNTSK